MKTRKNYLKRTLRFIWEEDNFWSWIINVVLAFVIIKFLVYPGLGFLLGTSVPVVAVVSESMEHPAQFDSWWSEPSCCGQLCISRTVQAGIYSKLNVSRSRFRSFPFVNGFNKGDIIVLYSPKKVEIGDIIVYGVSHRPDPIIHRVVRINHADGKRVFVTKGDNNCGIGPFEKDIPEDRVLGKAVWRLPWLGWVKIAFVELLQLFGVIA